MIFGFFAANPDKEARQLSRDVTTIVEMAEQTYRSELLDEIAHITREGCKHIAERCGDDATCRARELERCKSLHRDARRQNAQAKLTAYTLLIIDIRAAALGEPGAPVRVLIEEFLRRRPASDESALAD